MTEHRSTDVVIVGGGASGLAAAVELGMSSPELDVLVIEKMKEPARKLRATGSGRCNISNTEAAGYIDILKFLEKIGLVTKEYENGLVYPHSESAADVVDLLIARAEQLGVKLFCGESVTSIKREKSNNRTDKKKRNEDACTRTSVNSVKVNLQAFEKDNVGVNGYDSFRMSDVITNEINSNNRFKVESVYKDETGEHTVVTKSDYVILACGGKAGPMYGTTGDGYRLAKELGHRIITPVPVLTGVECSEWDDDYMEDPGMPLAITLAGTRADCEISLYRREDDYTYGAAYAAPFFAGDYIDLKPVFREFGELQFTKYGLSGICVFNMTRQMKYNKAEGGSLDDYFVKVNLFPGGSIADIAKNRMSGVFADAPLEEFLCTVLKKPLADYITAVIADYLTSFGGGHDGYDTPEKMKKMPISMLNDRDIQGICEVVHGMEFSPVGLRGWKDAQATSGGVSMEEIDEETTESKLCPGLFITGELADRDFPCGGFNLSNAWITGLAAARQISAIECDRKRETLRTI